MKSKMKSTMRKIIALVLLVLVVFALTACATNGNDSDTKTNDTSNNQTENTNSNDSASNEEAKVPQEKYIIGVAEGQASPDVTIRREFYENFIAPTYNVEFIFSEMCADDTATKAFIENCIDIGADAIIDFKSCNTTMAKLCEENDMVYVINSVPRSTNLDLFDGASSAFAGGVAGNNENTGAYIAEYVKNNSSDNGSEGFLIASAVASSGVVEHIQITSQVLKALQEKYGLTYTQDIDSIVASAEPVIVENDKGINIYVYPGSPNKDTWLTGVSPLLQTGDYGFFISCAETYDKSANVVDEVERSKNINIKVVSLGAISIAPVAFSTQDVFGNPSVDMIVVTASTIQSGTLFAVTYNALTNGADALYEDGKPTYFTVSKLAIDNLEDALLLNNWDSIDTQIWLTDQDILDKMLMSRSEGLNTADLKQYLSTLNFDTIKVLVLMN